MREEILTDLYNVFYTEAMQANRPDIDATVWAYDQACSTLHDLNRAEVRQFLREKRTA